MQLLLVPATTSITGCFVVLLGTQIHRELIVIRLLYLNSHDGPYP